MDKKEITAQEYQKSYDTLSIQVRNFVEEFKGWPQKEKEKLSIDQKTGVSIRGKLGVGTSRYKNIRSFLDNNLTNLEPLCVVIGYLNKGKK